MSLAAAHPFLPLLAETLSSTAATAVVRIGPLPWSDSLPATDLLEAADLAGGSVQPRRYDLALACLGEGTAREARQQIAAMRDLLARQLLVFVPENLLDDTALIGLGLNRQAHFDVEGAAWQAWSYDIRTYKSVPDWLNPKFWANPENWNKYRW